jgi:hypothetical protein
MDPMQWLMQLLQGGGMAGGQQMPMGIGETEMPMPGSPGMAAPPTQSPMQMPPPPQPVAVPQQPMSQMMPGPGFEQMGRMGAVAGPGPVVPGQVPGPGPAGAPAGAPGGGLSPQMLAALQALQPPEDENRGPPQPPGAPAGPRTIDPGLLFEALLKMGVHPGQIPSLTKSLGG